MKMLKRAYMVAAIGLAVATMSVSAAESYRVSAVLSHDGHSFASPASLVEREVPASVEVSGPQGYRLTLVAAGVKGESRVLRTP